MTNAVLNIPAGKRALLHLLSGEIIYANRERFCNRTIYCCPWNMNSLWQCRHEFFVNVISGWRWRGVSCQFTSRYRFDNLGLENGTSMTTQDGWGRLVRCLSRCEPRPGSTSPVGLEVGMNDVSLLRWTAGLVKQKAKGVWGVSAVQWNMWPHFQREGVLLSSNMTLTALKKREDVRTDHFITVPYTCYGQLAIDGYKRGDVMWCEVMPLPHHYAPTTECRTLNNTDISAAFHLTSINTLTDITAVKMNPGLACEDDLPPGL